MAKLPVVFASIGLFVAFKISARGLQNLPGADEKPVIPNPGLSEQDALDAVAYLYTLK